MHIVGHKIFVRMKDIPMYLSKKTKDSIRNRYSHSVEVGLGTEYVLAHVGRQLGNDVNLNFFHIAKIIGMVHDIGHTAFSHDGEMILDKALKEASKSYETSIRFNANLNNFRRIEKYALFDILPRDIKHYALASLVKRKKELGEYPEYVYMKEYLNEAIIIEEQYLRGKGVEVHNSTSKTILCQAMDIADENRYRVTDIIDALNIYSKQKLKEILLRGITSDVRVKELRKVCRIYVKHFESEKHIDKMTIKELLISLLNQESHAKTEFQNVMNSISMAFNRNFLLSNRGELVPDVKEIEQLRKDFHNIAAKYLWGSKKVQNIKKPFRHYFTTVVDYFINQNFDRELIDSSTYKKALIALEESGLNMKEIRYEKLLLLRNFLGGLTNQKIMDLYKRIKLASFEKKLGHDIDKREKLLLKESIPAFDKSLEKVRLRFEDKKSA